MAKETVKKSRAVKPDMTDMVVADSGTLTSPNRAAQLVSRSEIVNLLVVEYTEKVQAEIESLGAKLKTLNSEEAEAWENAYKAWYAQITATVQKRLGPWRDAICNALDVSERSPLASSQLPEPSRCSYQHGLNGPNADRADQNRGLVPISDVVQRWSDYTDAGHTVDFKATISGSRFGYNTKSVNLARFPMRWMFSPVSAESSWQELTTNFDILPEPDVVALFEKALEARNAHRVMCQKQHDLNSEIEDKNIARLEKKALARLTMQSLGENFVLPALG